jgi:hypothetical protein
LKWNKIKLYKKKEMERKNKEKIKWIKNARLILKTFLNIFKKEGKGKGKKKRVSVSKVTIRTFLINMRLNNEIIYLVDDMIESGNIEYACESEEDMKIWNEYIFLGL